MRQSYYLKVTILFWHSAYFSLFGNMNFWRNKSLKAQVIYILVILSIILIAEYFIVRNKLHSLTEAERKIDFARSVQVQNQQITLQAEFFLQGKKELDPNWLPHLISRIIFSRHFETVAG